MARRPFISIDQFKKNLIGKEINTCHSFSAANCRWNAMHIPLCVWCSPCPLWGSDETIDRGSGPTCSLFPPWRPSMKPSIVPPVLFDETIGRAVVLHLQVYYYTYPLPSWALQKLTVVAVACISHHCCSSWAFILSKLWQRQPTRNAFTKRSWTQRPFYAWSSSGSLGQYSQTRQLVRLWARFAPFLHAMRLKSQRLWSLGPARSDVRKHAGCARVSWCQIWRKRSPAGCTRVGWCQIWHKQSPKQTQWAGLTCLAALEICVKRWEINAFGKESVWVLIYQWGLRDQNDDIMNTLLMAGSASVFSMKIS